MEHLTIAPEVQFNQRSVKLKDSMAEIWMTVKHNLPGENDYPELSEILDDFKPLCPYLCGEDILQWISKTFKSSRGFELGIYNPSILKTIWRTQSEKWELLALSYIGAVILVVHHFVLELLSTVCPDSRVRSNLMMLIVETLQQRHEHAVRHTKFVLDVERSGKLLTTNHYFNETLERCRQARTKAALETHSNEDSTPILEELVQTGNAEYTIQDKHDILQSYYRVCRKRFVDTIIMQCADYHLVTGEASPLRVFTPVFISSLN